MADNICRTQTALKAERIRRRKGSIRSLVTFWLVAVLWVALCDLSGARIGETLDQVLKRYGRCLKTMTAENGMVYKLFSNSGFKILVHFYENKVDEISYGKDTDVFDDDLKALMQDNAPGQWVGSGLPTVGTTRRESAHAIPFNIGY
jgi:hypothetical protein